MINATKVCCGAPDKKYNNTNIIPIMIVVLEFLAAIL